MGKIPAKKLHHGASRGEMSLLEESLSQLKDSSAYSSRNTSKGALIKEIFALFSAVRQGLPIPNIREAILSSRVFQKSSYETRRKIWNSVNHRYLSVCPAWTAGSLAAATEKGVESPEFLSLAYLYYALRDRLTFEFVTGPVWEKWRDKVTSVDKGLFMTFLDDLSEESPVVNKWRDSTRTRLASQALSALRDFGVLRGARLKHIQRPPVASETVYHLLCILESEGKKDKAIIEALDWRIFLWTPAEVSSALIGLSKKRWIRFERANGNVLIELVRLPEMMP